jgi:hypothetical protein
MNVKISLALHGVYEAILPPEERTAPLLDPFKYNALYIIRNHLHIDLKSEYLMEEELNVLWAALQTCYEQQNSVILPEANHDWIMLRLQDFKSIGEYNHVVHKICVRLRFCEKEPLKQIKLKRHFKLCILRIGSYNTNTMPIITKLTQILFVISSKQKSMMSLY